MSRFWKRSMGCMVVLALAGCGGPATDEAQDTAGENQQALAQCSVDVPCSNVNYYCDKAPGAYFGVCRPKPID